MKSQLSVPGRFFQAFVVLMHSLNLVRKLIAKSELIQQNLIFKGLGLFFFVIVEVKK